MGDIFGFVFYNLSQSQRDGDSLDEAVLQLEKAVEKKYGLDHGILFSLVAGEALKKLKEHQKDSISGPNKSL
jgi:hypothetical protein